MKKLLGFSALCMAVSLAAFPETAFRAAGEALALCAHTLLPSLFPFFVCANVVISAGLAEQAGQIFSGVMGKLFRVNGKGAAAVVLGFISGYPAGAAVSCKLYTEGSITKSEAERLLSFTNNAGPLFILGTVGLAAYGSRAAGVVLYVSVVLASLFTGCFMRRYGNENTVVRNKKGQGRKDPMGEAVGTILLLCGYVIFFAVLLAFAKKLGVVSMLCRGLTCLGLGQDTAALLSMGIFEISTAASSTRGALPAMAALLSFGGLSVLLQTASVVRLAGLSLKPYILGKCISACLSAAICHGILHVFTISLETAVFLQKTTVYTEYLAAAVLMSIGVYLLYRLLSKICP